MTDSLTKEKRSWNMSRIHSKDTKPELLVRSLLHRNGYRFRVHNIGLPGKPDIVLTKYKTVVFVHGCFWHRHRGCPDATIPKTRTDFWMKKFEESISRDRRATTALRNLDWHVVVVWECELKNTGQLIKRLRKEITKSSNVHCDNYTSSKSEA